MKDSYQSIKNVTEGIYKEKGSKFLSFAYPVSNHDEIDKILTLNRKKYYDARHHCYAYILGGNKEIFKSNDDGEPRHTAGDPILNQIKSLHLSNVLVIVVRYFGGTKLGKSGLINAYKIAARDALEKVQLVQKYFLKNYRIDFAYEGTSQVMRIFQDNDLNIIEQNYEELCSIQFSVRESLATSVISKLEKINEITEISEVAREFTSN